MFSLLLRDLLSRWKTNLVLVSSFVAAGFCLLLVFAFCNGVLDNFYTSLRGATGRGDVMLNRDGRTIHKDPADITMVDYFRPMDRDYSVFLDRLQSRYASQLEYVEEMNEYWCNVSSEHGVEKVGLIGVSFAPENPVFHGITLVEGELPWLRSGGRPLRNPILLSEELYRRLQVSVGDRIFAQGFTYDNRPNMLVFEVAGAYKATPQTEGKAYVPFGSSQTLLNFMGYTVVTSLYLRRREDVRPFMEELANDPFVVGTGLKVYDLSVPFHREFTMYRILNSVYRGIAIIVLMLFTLGAMNVIAGEIGERHHEIALMKLLGLDRGRLFGYYIAKTLLVSLAAVALGMGGGIATCSALNRAGIRMSSWEQITLAGGIERLQFVVRSGDTLWIGVTVVAALSVVALYQVRSVSRTSIVENLSREL